MAGWRIETPQFWWDIFSIFSEIFWFNSKGKGERNIYLLGKLSNKWFHCLDVILVLTEGNWRSPFILWQITLEISRMSAGRFTFWWWWANWIFRTSTRSKSFKIQRSKNRLLEIVRDALKVINLSAAFWKLYMWCKFEFSLNPHSWYA